ncbi:hypothetical protein Tsubulata_029907 [Turnera subulata]|uniref:CCHC-type domain-containing protein n=1 Tax=Turnera subulata TaxID=218843 RepID=A0A9Q0JE16_9ROSI|nr:hypothetical protein Tsubulata_029907 [Turnera subulata]
MMAATAFIVNPLLAQTPLPTFTHVRSLLLAFESRVSSRQQADTTPVTATSTALVAAPLTSSSTSVPPSSSQSTGPAALVMHPTDRAGSFRNFRGRGRGRGRRGGYYRGYNNSFYQPRLDYPTFPRPPSSSHSGILGVAPPLSSTFCHYCGAPGHIARSCPTLAQQSLSAVSIHDTAWYPDSGASVHMTNNSGMLLTFKPYLGPDKICVGDGPCSVPLDIITCMDAK